MLKLIAAITSRPDIPPNARFVIEDEKQSPASIRLHLFGNGLWLITPLVWLLFVFNLMGFFFLISWTPTLMAARKGAADHRGACRRPPPGRRHGRRIGAVLVVAAQPLPRHRHPVRGGGAGGRLDRLLGNTSAAALLASTFCAGFLVLGIQTGINVVGAMIYPTSLRANGSGWEFGIGRFGSIVGPVIGALFVGLPLEILYAYSALPFRRRRDRLLRRSIVSTRHGCARIRNWQRRSEIRHHHRCTSKPRTAAALRGGFAGASG